jgi:hypothetical protein
MLTAFLTSSSALRHRELRVAGARRQVDHHDVELAPGDVAQHLLDGALHHRPAPDHRRVLVDEKAHRHDLDAVGLQRRQLLAVGSGRRPAREPDHAWQGRPVDVGVEKARAPAERGEPHREVHRGGGLADAALARGHRDDRAHALGERALRGGVGGGLLGGRGPARGRSARARSGALGRQHRRHGGHAGEFAHGRLGGAADRLEGLALIRTHLDGETDIRVLDDEARDHTRRDDVLVGLGRANATQRRQHRLAIDRAHG